MFQKKGSQLDAYIKVMSQLKDIVQDDIMTTVADRDRFLVYYPGDKMRVPIKAGDRVPAEDPLYTTIRENKIIQAIVPKEVYGIPFKAVTYPIQNESGECIGAIGYAKSLDKEYAIRDTLDNTERLVRGSKQGLEAIVEHVASIAGKTQANSAAVQQITASVDEMTGVVNEVHEIVDDTQHFSHKVMESAVSGETAVQSIVNSVHDIDQSSQNAASLIQDFYDSTQKIGSIVDMIKQISEQTNLLALNAAIEAARAGENGRGFAVVAEEVRKLAEQSKDSTQSISSLISEIQGNIEGVITAVTHTGSIIQGSVTMTEALGLSITGILENMRTVDDKIQDITEKSSKQLGMARHVSTAIESIAQSVIETAQSSNNISMEAHRQMEMFVENGVRLNEAMKSLTED